MSLFPRARNRTVLAIFGATVLGIVASGTAQELERVFITEFAAANVRGLRDRDRETSDWIELCNAGSQPVNLEGWSLTDDPNQLTRWRFPAVTLAPKDYLVVFASGKGRRTGPELHTNFKLSADGDFLALVRPDGRTIASQFAPSYPSQVADASFGVAMQELLLPLVSRTSRSRVLVPAGELPAGWTSVDFDDQRWTAASGGVGFGGGTNDAHLIGADVRAAMFGKGASVFARLPFTVTDTEFESLRLHVNYDDGFVAYLNGREIARRNAPASPQWNSTATAVRNPSAGGGLEENFDSDTANYVLDGADSATRPKVGAANTGSPSRFLRLVNGRVGDQIGTFQFPRTAAPPFTSMEAEFDFRCRSQGSDGDAIYFLLVPGDASAGAGGLSVSTLRGNKDPNFPGVFAVRLRLFPSEEPGYISAHWDKARRVHAPLGGAKFAQRVFHRARIQLRFGEGGAHLSVGLTPDVAGTTRTAASELAVINDQLIPGLKPFEARVQLVGRAATVDRTIDVDNIRVRFGATSGAASEEIDLAAAGLLRAGPNVLALHGMNSQVDDPSFLLAAELTGRRFTIQPASFRYFSPPTPRALNREGFAEVSLEPKCSPAGGVFTKTPTVELRSKAPRATIRYTLDGSEPTTNSTLYSGPISLERTVLLKARAFAEGMLPSATVTETYTLAEANLGEFNSNLPLVILNPFGSYLSRRHTTISARFIDGGPERATLLGEAEFDGRAEANVRGYSSLRFPRRSLTVRLRDRNGDKQKVSLLGMPKDSDWVLYAPFADKTLIRDALAYELSNAMGRYAPRTRFVEVFMQSGDRLSMRDYQGVYVLEERITRGKHRVNIEAMSADDTAEPAITGGYLFKRDHVDRESEDFYSDRGSPFFLVSPKRGEITREQLGWLANYVNTFERVLHSPHFADPQRGYRKYLDVDAFIDQHWLIEMSKNIDGFRYSAYLHKARGGKLVAGPAWDWNLSFGNADYHRGWDPEGWYTEEMRESEICWFRRLSEDPEFAQRAIDRWSELRAGPFAPTRIAERIDAMAAQLNEAQQRNFQRWRILGREVTPNYYVGDTYADEIRWMKEWVRKRIAWIDNQFVSPPVSSRSGSVVGLKSAGGKILFTLDGSDPRAPGGGKSASAQTYDKPLPAGSTTVLVARVQRGGSWSGPITVRGDSVRSATP